MRLFALALLAVSLPAAPIDGVVTNGTTGKPQAGATVTLFRVGGNGPESLQSVKTDAAGRFTIDREAAGPRLLQAAYDGVTYNKMIPPGAPSSGLEIQVYQSIAKPGAARVDQHMMLLEPQPDNRMSVSESYVWSNTGKTTFNDPAKGTLQFYLPPGAQGQVTVNVLAPQGMPIRRAPDKTATPNVLKVDFPIKPGESRIDLSYALPFTSPGEFAGKILYKGGPTRLIVPPGVSLAGTGVQNMGQGPMNATIYSTELPDFKLQITGTGVLRGQGDDTGGQGSTDSGSGSGGIAQIMPKLYGSTDPKTGFSGAVDAVKWLLLMVFAILSLGFALLYRAGAGVREAPVAKAKSGRR
ncbi:MAG: carboxypeptidase-like regulatory domain-containing protein [Acidobacteriota bacterium]|nr:carboxypeptidase-like regulatory domain-containing protein [Acidobacteriota bacterium]